MFSCECADSCLHTTDCYWPSGTWLWSACRRWCYVLKEPNGSSSCTPGKFYYRRELREACWHLFPSNFIGAVPPAIISKLVSTLYVGRCGFQKFQKGDTRGPRWWPSGKLCRPEHSNLTFFGTGKLVNFRIFSGHQNHAFKLKYSHTVLQEIQQMPETSYLSALFYLPSTVIAVSKHK